MIIELNDKFYILNNIIINIEFISVFDNVFFFFFKYDGKGWKFLLVLFGKDGLLEVLIWLKISDIIIIFKLLVVFSLIEYKMIFRGV